MRRIRSVISQKLFLLGGLAILLSSCGRKNFGTERPDIVKWYQTTDISDSLVIKPNDVTMYKGVFPLCNIVRNSLVEETICFSDCDCIGPPRGFLEFTLVESELDRDGFQNGVVYILNTTFYRKYSEGNGAVFSFNLFPGLRGSSGPDGLSLNATRLYRMKRGGGWFSKKKTVLKEEDVHLVFSLKKESDDEIVITGVNVYDDNFLGGNKSLVFNVADVLGDEVLILKKVSQ